MIFDAADLTAAAEEYEKEMEKHYIYTKPVRGADLQKGMVIVKGKGRNRSKTVLERRIPIFDGQQPVPSGGRACNGIHFVDSHGQVGCWDRSALNDVIVE